MLMFGNVTFNVKYYILSPIFIKKIGFGIFMPYTLGTDQTIGLAKLQKFGLVQMAELTKA